MKNTIIGLFFLSVLGTSCKKDDNPAPVEPPVQYMSLTAGSSWNYELTDNVASTTKPFTITCTASDSSTSARSYHVFTNTNGGNQYYNITGNDYYNFLNLPAAFGGSSIEYLYLKDNAAAASTWTQTSPVTASGIAFQVTLLNTITEKGISKTVKGIAYDNVIHVITTMTVTVGGAALPASALTTDIESYYAPKVGMIQSINKIDLNFSGITDHTDQLTSLISSDIK